VHLRPVAVERDRDLVRSGQDHPVGALGIADSRAVDDREATQAKLAAFASDREVILEIEHALAAADDDGAARTKLCKLAEHLAAPLERQIARAIVVVELPEIAVLAAQVAALVGLQEQEVRRCERLHGVR
jgi:hypothetical protein